MTARRTMTRRSLALGGLGGVLVVGAAYWDSLTLPAFAFVGAAL
jgi:hypothetical protein